MHRAPAPRPSSRTIAWRICRRTSTWWLCCGVRKVCGQGRGACSCRRHDACAIMGVHAGGRPCAHVAANGEAGRMPAMTTPLRADCRQLQARMPRAITCALEVNKSLLMRCSWQLCAVSSATGTSESKFWWPTRSVVQVNTIFPTSPQRSARPCQVVNNSEGSPWHCFHPTQVRVAG